MRPKVRSFEELVNANKQAIQNDKQAMTNVEKKVDQRHVRSYENHKSQYVN
ncbi:FbpB family small basic protein [Pontibacillus yanchengensis]|uniref:FbpB family small basic protein n=1 Tax=Pontibacillus yanchengensis TaxID=462910 RepID=UPI0009FCBAAF|nr:FbpB family small basic protein [Pontibacillus yanchengensis]